MRYCNKPCRRDRLKAGVCERDGFLICVQQVLPSFVPFPQSPTNLHARLPNPPAVFKYKWFVRVTLVQLSVCQQDVSWGSIMKGFEIRLWIAALSHSHSPVHPCYSHDLQRPVHVSHPRLTCL
jgi:hypothetical protein